MRRVDVELYAHPLVACIRDARAPQPEEVTSLGRKLWSEGVAHLEVQNGHWLAQRLATVALTGTHDWTSGTHKQEAQDEAP
jgi:hypothetical protein